MDRVLPVQMAVVATVPGGQSMVVNVNGQEMAVTVPMGIQVGGQFTFQAPTAPMVAVAQPMVQPAVAMVPAQLPHTWSKFPMQVTCPHCNTNGMTRVQYESGCGTWLACLGVCAVGCDLGCCFIPFCINDCKDAHHYCGACSQKLGVQAICN